MTDIIDNQGDFKGSSDSSAAAELPGKTTSSDLYVRQYTEEEVTSIYELARLSFETGNYRRAEIICRGLVAVAHEFVPSHLLLAIVLSFSKNYEHALSYTQDVLRMDSGNLQAQLLSASLYLCLANYNMAGTVLGEISERIRQGVEITPTLKRFFEIQLARFEAR